MEHRLAVWGQNCATGTDTPFCPSGFCCVHDEFLLSSIVCKPLPTSGSRCTTKPSDNECPCETGYMCANNANGDVTFVFGKCYPNVTNTTTTTETPSPETSTPGTFSKKKQRRTN
ncbi:hypothetical protein MAR_017073 [Mya arenaria]|uniref:Uncharacterized protein n=1 Tax=Mya arenaria TaxID=6604 RepID=A0ABY7EAP8_MYAAR|nr:hypothetical protein MAR_017073 [Mya arenaria]